MSTWSPENSVVTNLGGALLSQARVGLATIKLTRVVARENFETTISNARTYTLSDITEQSIAQEGYIMGISVAEYPDPEEDIETSLMTVRFSNDDLEDPEATYNLRQIIVFACSVSTDTGEESEEVPYMVCQCDSSSDCDVMPARSLNPTSFDYDIYVLHAGVEEVSISVRTEGYVWQEDFENFQADVAQDFIDLEATLAGVNSEGSTVTAWTPSWSDDDHSTWSAEDASSTVTCQDGAERFNIHAEKVYNRDNIAYGKRSAAFGGMSEALGDDSFAAGLCNYVSGSNSAAFGTRNAVEGTSSFVCGSNNEIKSGSYASCVFGLSNVAESPYSATFGKNLVNKSSYSLIIGKYNDYSSEAPETYAFVIGDGISGARHNLVTIDWTGEMFLSSIRVGNIKKPNGEPYSFDVNIDYIKGGSGIKSFIANDIDNNNSNGFYSTTFGTGCSANGNSSIAAGMDSIADKMCSVAIGKSAKALGKHSFALGNGSFVSADSEECFAFYGAIQNTTKCSVAMSGTVDGGMYNATIACDFTCTVSDSTSSIMMGCATSEINSSEYCVALGADSSHVEDSEFSFIFGASNSVTNSNNVFVFGEGNKAVNLQKSYLFGDNLEAGSQDVEVTAYKFIIGKFNENTDTEDSEKIFVIGNGTGNNSRSNAFEVDQNGNIFCGGSNRSLNAQIADNTEDITELNGSVSDLSGNITVDRAALIEIINNGPKNHAKVNSFSATLHQAVDVEPISGTIHLHIGEYTSTDTDTTNFIIIFRYTDGTTATRTLDKGAVDAEYNLANYVLDRVDVYSSDTWNHSTGDTVTVSELMVCSKLEWDISNKYVPYRPSYDELVARVEALENAT